jgi:putative phosphoribosyl transferase
MDSRANLRVLSYSEQPFRDREQAGHLLAEQLTDLQNKHAVVLGIPRGGIIVARELGRKIDPDLDIVLARKLGTPGQSELAMGSVSENGMVFLNERVINEVGISDREIGLEKARQMDEIQRRRQFIRRVLPKIPLKGRVVIVTDDGAATGATMQAALWAARQEEPQKLIAAIPVASEEALDRFTLAADDVICLRRPSNFFGVGQFYVRFSQVDDQEMLQILAEESAKRKIKSSGGKNAVI